MNHLTIADVVMDPNPREAAEYSLTISAFDWQTVDGDAIMFEMVPLYDKQVKWALICRVLDELEKYSSTIIYTGTYEKCQKWSEIFLNMGLMTTVDEI